MALRKFRGTDVQMLLASGQIADHGIEHVEILSARRSQWKNPFFPDLKARITTALSTNVGVDPLSKVKDATAAVDATLETAHRGLMDLKVDIEVGFKKTPTRMKSLLTLLGLNMLKAKNSKQSSYVDIMLTLKNNLTAAVKAELVAAGANPTAIDALLLQATQLVEANDKQELLKVTRKDVNTVNVEELNAIYDEVISVCKLATTYFVGNSTLLEQFNFTKALKAQGYVPPVRKKKPPKDGNK
jgi:hypothetical protein